MLVDIFKALACFRTAAPSPYRRPLPARWPERFSPFACSISTSSSYFTPLDALDQHQRADDLAYGRIFFKHRQTPSVSALIWSLSSLSMLSKSRMSSSGIYLARPMRSRTLQARHLAKIRARVQRRRAALEVLNDKAEHTVLLFERGIGIHLVETRSDADSPRGSMRAASSVSLSFQLSASIPTRLDYFVAARTSSCSMAMACCRRPASNLRRNVVVEPALPACPRTANSSAASRWPGNAACTPATRDRPQNTFTMRSVAWRYGFGNIAAGRGNRADCGYRAGAAVAAQALDPARALVELGDDGWTR